MSRSRKASATAGGRRRWAALALVGCAQAEGITGTPQAGAAGVGGPGADAATLTEAEWQAAIAPRPGVHEVHDAACGGERISRDYRVVPTVGCIGRRDERGNTTETRDCALEAYCTTAAECTAQARGICTGTTYAYCEYRGLELGAACESDADCSTLPGGLCRPSIEPGGQLCYPTGECRTTPPQSCGSAALHLPCESDADCTLAPGGTCRRTISFPQCAYNECDTVNDCAPGARCECFGVRQCIPADCFGDADCDAATAASRPWRSSAATSARPSVITVTAQTTSARATPTASTRAACSIPLCRTGPVGTPCV